MSGIKGSKTFSLATMSLELVEKGSKKLKRL